MDSNIEALIREIMQLRATERAQLLQTILHSLRDFKAVTGVSDSSSMSSFDLRVKLEKELEGMTSVTVNLPDELARRAQDAGLLSEARLAELINGALSAQNDETPSRSSSRRRLIRDRNRMIAESLPGDRKVSNEEVQELINKMEW